MKVYFAEVDYRATLIEYEVVAKPKSYMVVKGGDHSILMGRGAYDSVLLKSDERVHASKMSALIYLNNRLNSRIDAIKRNLANLDAENKAVLMVILEIQQSQEKTDNG